VTGNREQGTGDREQGTGNREQVIDPSGKVILNQLFVSEPGKFENPNTTKC
jgi:hypothetical protein